MKTEDLWPEIKWCIKNAKISQQHDETISISIAKGLTDAMKSRLMLFFRLNYSVQTEDGYIVNLENEGETIALGTQPYHFCGVIGIDTYSSIEN